MAENQAPKDLYERNHRLPLLREREMPVPALPRRRLQVPLLLKRKLSMPAKLSQLRLLLAGVGLLGVAFAQEKETQVPT
jgi:hypothetical protein